MSHPTPHSTPHETPHVEPHLDSWHQHSAAEGAPQREHAGQVNAGLLAATMGGILTFVVVFVAIIAVYLNSRLARDRAEAMETTYARGAYLQYRDAATSSLEQWSWVDRAGGTVRAPIEAAQARVLGQYGAQQSDGS